MQPPMPQGPDMMGGDPNMMGGDPNMMGGDPDMMGGDQNDMGGSDFDTNFDAGVDADEDSDPKKFIQQLTGKLSTELNKYNNEIGEPDEDLCKYVAKMIVAQACKGLDDKAKKELIKKINSVEGDVEEMPSDDDMMDDDMEEQQPMEQPMQESLFEDFDNSELQIQNHKANVSRKQETKKNPVFGFSTKDFTK